MIVKKSYKILLNIFILSYLLIIKIQCLKLNIGLIKESNVIEIRSTDYQSIGPLGKDHDYYVLENGDQYDGKFVNGLANDTKGLYYFKDKPTYYCGEFKDGKIEGRGFYYRKRLAIPRYTIYKGEFRDGMADGKGLYTYKNGDKYKGEFRKSKREGKGEYEWNKKNNNNKELITPYLFKGYFENDNFGEFGTYFYTNGDKYIGRLKDGKKHGKGTYYFEDGDRYEGDFKNDKREGSGVYYWKDGDRDMGDYLNDKEVGMHVIVHANGQVTQKYY